MNILSQIISSAVDRLMRSSDYYNPKVAHKVIDKTVNKTAKVVNTLYPKYAIAVKAYKTFCEYAAQYVPLENGLQKTVANPTNWGPFFKARPNQSWDITTPSFMGTEISHIQQILLNIFQDVDDPMVMQAMVAQILSKQLVSATGVGAALVLGQELQIPMMNNQGQKELVTYTLDAKFDLWCNIPAYGFIPHKCGYPPLLMFRSTNILLNEEGTLASLISNFHPKGSGWKLFANSQMVVSNWLAQKNSEYETKGIVYGYSLGGAVASYFLTYYPQLFDQDVHRSSIILDAPGVNKQIETEWLKIEAKPSVWLFVNQGDIIPKIGEAFIGRAFEVKTSTLLKGFDCHRAFTFFDPFWKMVEISTHLEKQTVARSILSKCRNFLGKTIYTPVKQLLFPQPLLVSILGVSV